MSAIKTTAVNIKMDLVIQETFGLYSLSMKLKTTKSPKSISTKILKTKPFPVINGKKKVEGTIKGIKGTRSKPAKIKYSIIFFVVFIAGV
jgi:hypothetical protein